MHKYTMEKDDAMFYSENGPGLGFNFGLGF